MRTRDTSPSAPSVTRSSTPSKLLLAPIVGRKVALADAPAAGFLSELYPDHADFALPFEDAKVLSQAWDWYEKGGPRRAGLSRPSV